VLSASQAGMVDQGSGTREDDVEHMHDHRRCATAWMSDDGDE
jgi:hypothetical protein